MFYTSCRTSSLKLVVNTPVIYATFLKNIMCLCKPAVKDRKYSVKSI